ncbi:efflux RND transporter permease subunit [Treponema pectinovorum]|uniref:efflux RND transporter permease subunit n=1 Tax=Treponema pectinovorum TaxID=164 RepID=UPI0011CA2259|nr:efflux RND transporter permease subunit [Treponema pectinovorum]
MNKEGSFYRRKIFLFFIFIAITLIFGICAFKVEKGFSKSSKYQIFSIEFDYFGMDSKKLEEIILIPLESLLMKMEDLKDLSSASQYSKTVTTAYFDKRSDFKRNYLSIRNIAQNMYNSLPGDVQKPRIYCSESESKSSISTAFFGTFEELDNLRDFLEKNIKNKVEAIDGVSEVLINGGSLKEVQVDFDVLKSAASLQNPDEFARVIQDSNAVSSASKIKHHRKNEIVNFETKINSIEQIKKIPVKLNDSLTQLEYLSNIDLKPKAQDEFVLIDCKNAVLLNIVKTSDANEMRISKSFRKILESNFNKSDFKILYDSGEKQKELLTRVLLALAESLLCVVLIIPFFYRRKTVALIFLLLIINCVWTFGLLFLFKNSLNQNTIAGISIALGLISDCALVISETEEECATSGNFFERIKTLLPSIISSSLTTVLCLLPLFFLENIVSGAKNIALSICLMIFSSLFIVIFFYPSFVYSDENRKKTKNEDILRKIAEFCSNCNSRFTRINKFIYFVMAIVPFVLFLLGGKNLNLENEMDVLYCSADYESNTSAEYISKEVNRIAEKIREKDFITFVKTVSHKGNAEIEIGFNNKISRRDCAKFVNNYKNYISDAFFYVPYAESKKNKNTTTITVCVSGDESEKCRQIVQDTTGRIAKSAIADSVVMNFKKNEIEYVFAPDKTLLSKGKLSVQAIASNLRWQIFGYVADKWLENGREYDIKIFGRDLNKANIEKVKNLYMPFANTAVKISCLGKIEQKLSAGKIFRKNNRRCAYFTVEFSNLSTDKAVSVLKSELEKMLLERGYTFSFDREISKMKEHYDTLLAMLLFAVVSIFILLVILTEDFKKSFRIISIIPVSICLPVLLRFFSFVPFETGDIVGMVVLSGITVNNAIYIEGADGKTFGEKLLQKLKSIIVTSLTTIVGSIPLYFMSGDGFSKNLSFFMIFGIIDSLAVTLLLYGTFCNRKHRE